MQSKASTKEEPPDPTPQDYQLEAVSAKMSRSYQSSSSISSLEGKARSQDGTQQ